MSKMKLSTFALHDKTHICQQCRLNPETCGKKPVNSWECKYGQVPIYFDESSEFTQKQMDWLKEREFRKSCMFDYKSLHCGYTGELTECNKTIEDCKQHGNIARFGGILPIGCG